MEMFNLKVCVNLGGTSNNPIVGYLNQTPCTRADIEALRDNMYPKLMNLNYFVMFNDGVECWIPSKLIEQSIITFEIVTAD